MTAVLEKLALAALDRGDITTARELLVGALALAEGAAPSRSAESVRERPELATLATFARLVDASSRTVRRWIVAGGIPSSAIVGSGRGLRIRVTEALAALHAAAPRSAEDAGRAFVASRGRFRVMPGGVP